MNEWIKKIGIDKFAHFGIGGLICAFFSFVFILQEPSVSWLSVLFTIPGIICTFFMSVLKEYMFDDKFEWKDVIWSVSGCIPVVLSVVFGMLIHID